MPVEVPLAATLIVPEVEIAARVMISSLWAVTGMT